MSGGYIYDRHRLHAATSKMPNLVSARGSILMLDDVYLAATLQRLPNRALRGPAEHPRGLDLRVGGTVVGE